MPTVTLILSEEVQESIGEEKLAELMSVVEDAKASIEKKKTEAAEKKAAEKKAEKDAQEQRRQQRAADAQARKDEKYRRHRAKGLPFAIDKFIADVYQPGEGSVPWDEFYQEFQLRIGLNNFKWTYAETQIELPKEHPLVDGQVTNLVKKPS